MQSRDYFYPCSTLHILQSQTLLCETENGITHFSSKQHHGIIKKRLGGLLKAIWLKVSFNDFSRDTNDTCLSCNTVIMLKLPRSADTSPGTTLREGESEREVGHDERRVSLASRSAVLGIGSAETNGVFATYMSKCLHW
jgi:hypothetical protein